MRYPLLLIISLIYTFVNAQYIQPNSGFVFDDQEVPTVEIIMDQDSLDFILDYNNAESNYEFPAIFILKKEGIIDTVHNVGFRLRGNTSRYSSKKSFKVSFNTFEKGKKYKGLEKLNLNGEHNDPSIVRSKLGWDLCKFLNIPSSRSNHMKLYINGTYMGLYINVEHIDEEFLQERFTNPDGNLYKCLWPANLHYISDNPNDYKNTGGGRKTYELKTNLDNCDYSDLTEFIDILNNSSNSNFKCDLERVFDVENYLKAMVMDILISNWDGPIINKNNFYLYHNPENDKFVYIPYDLDNSFGITWFDVPWHGLDIYNWSVVANEYRPIYERIMSVKEYRDKFSFHFNKVIQEYFGNEEHLARIDEIKNMIREHRVFDSFAKLDYGWSLQDFERSYDDALGAHVRYGLKEYISRRRSTAQDQLVLDEIKPGILYNKNKIINDSLFIEFNGYTDSNFSNYELSLCGNIFQINTIDNSPAIFKIPLQEINCKEYYLLLKGNNGLEKRYPECGFLELTYDTNSTPEIIINEVMSNNTSSATDDFGEYEDWIELYNPNDFTISLKGLFLSDRAENPRKWALPSRLILPNSYLILYADGDQEQGELHGNFKLNKDGEYLGLFDTNENYNRLIDNVLLPRLEKDYSYARIPNGYGEFEITEQVTFGYNNNEYSSISNNHYFSDIYLFPNPTKDYILLESSKVLKTYALQSTTGKTIQSGFLIDNKIELRDIPDGLYYLLISDENNIFFTKKLIKLQ